MNKLAQSSLDVVAAQASSLARRHVQEDTSWIAHAYPLQQIRIDLQGTRHSDRAAVIDQLETVLSRLRAGELAGGVDDDDFGYRFAVDVASPGPSIFDGSPYSTVRPD
jgi:hypothetical protein